MSGKGDVCAGKEPKDKKKVMPLVEKVELMAKLDRGNEHCYCQMLLWFKQINSLFHGSKC